MGIAMILVLCSFVGKLGISSREVDMPYLSVQAFGKAQLKCCHLAIQDSKKIQWMKSKLSRKIVGNEKFLTLSENIIQKEAGKKCSILIINYVQRNDTGLYQCVMNTTGPNLTDGTYLLVFGECKTIICEITCIKHQNKILTSEGILLLLCVVFPSAILLCKIERSQGQGPYQDVCNFMEEEDIQLEKTLKEVLSFSRA
uniref:Ig-like domain-containing protein n=1 Tax=Echeneis naucrates TaxID=173247 RepID=A0A665WF11_ECHNA